MDQHRPRPSRSDGQPDARNAHQSRNECPATSRDVQAQLLELDCDPIAGMAKLANDDTVPTVLRARMFAELATYIAPRRKAVELSGPNGGPVEAHCIIDYSALSIEELGTLGELLNKASGRGHP
jgi:hypothetical protein